MKKFIIFPFIAIIIISCQSKLIPPSDPEQIQNLSNAATQIALTGSARQTATQAVEQTATQSALYLLNPQTPTPTAIDINNETATILFRDDFDKLLQTGWQWTNEIPENWSLIEKPGDLQINVVGGYVNLQNASNMLTVPAPQGDFYIETSLLFDPDTDNQFAGLIMYESDNEYIQTGASYCSPINGCIGKGLYIDIYQEGNLLLPRTAIDFIQDRLAIRMVHYTGKIVFYASLDGKVWYRISEFATDINVSRVGLITGQSIADLPKPALFEYFEIGTLK